jgi:hypothetical protein
MQIELLRAKPISGEVAELSFDASAHTNTWASFDEEGGAKWVGIFGNGGAALFSSAVAFPDDAGAALIIAGGQGYVVDTKKRVLLRKTKWSYSYSAVAVPDRDFVIVANTTDIWAVFRDRDVSALCESGEGGPKDPRRIALDGIVLDEPSSKSLTGKLWMRDGWHDFDLDLDTLQLIVGRQIAQGAQDFQAGRERGGFPFSNDHQHWMQQFWL